MRNEGIIKPLTVERVGSTLADTGRGRLRANARIDALYLNTQNINGSARTLTLFFSHRERDGFACSGQETPPNILHRVFPILSYPSTVSHLEFAIFPFTFHSLTLVAHSFNNNLLVRFETNVRDQRTRRIVDSPRGNEESEAKEDRIEKERERERGRGKICKRERAT